FEIARQSLISAARQVEAAREELLLLGNNADPTSTQNILNALTNILLAKNALIDSWVSYEVGRFQLLLDLEAFQVDERGIDTDECWEGADFLAPPGDQPLHQPPAPAGP